VKVALVHDWLTGMRGGERVLQVVAELYPDAPIHTLLQVKGTVSPTLEQRRIVRSFVQLLPAAGRHYRQYLPLFPTAIEQFDFDAFDLVISTSHCAAKSVVVPGRARHVCYCHSPMRYAWDQFDAYFGPAQVGQVRSRLLRPVLARLARWDAATADRVDRFVANSRYVAGRIRRYYNREASVVYPPVNTDFYEPDPARRPEYFLVVSAMVPYKRLDMAIRACELAGVPLKMVGRGPEEARLRAMAGPNVEFLGWISDEHVRRLYQGSHAVVMPGVEDFGMVPVEAQACGRPVIAYAEGGALESVIDGHTGVLVREQSAEAFAEAVAEVSTRSFDTTAIRRHAQGFSVARFKDQFSAIAARDGSTDSPSPRALSRGEDGTVAASVDPRRSNSAAREDERVAASVDPCRSNSAAREDERAAASVDPCRSNSAAREDEQ
jgi:glycosyltransferase involved in cell wall biosynthesis